MGEGGRGYEEGMGERTGGMRERENGRDEREREGHTHTCITDPLFLCKQAALTLCQLYGELHRDQ